MDIIDERGTFYVPSRVPLLSGIWTQVGTRPLYYTKVVWKDGFKFVLGSWDTPSGQLETMIEVSSGGIAVRSTDFKQKPLLADFIRLLNEKCERAGGNLAEVVNKFNNDFNIQLWQTKLWAL